MTHKWHYLASALCLAMAMGFTSCGDDDGDDNDGKSPYEETIDSKAGKFMLKNLVTGVEISPTGSIAFDGDTLLLEFTPKETYHVMTFDVTCMIDGKNVEVKDGKIIFSAGAGSHELKCSAVAKLAAAIDGKTDAVWSATTIYELERPESYANVPLNVQISNDLLQFVTAELSYTDSYGVTQTHVITDDEWVRSDSVAIFVFKDENGTSHYRTSDAKPLDGEDSMTLNKVLKYLPDPSYSFNARYYDALDVTSDVILSYRLREGATVDRDNYDFNHELSLGENATIIAPGVVYVDYSININLNLHFGDETKTKRADVQAYLDKLIATPDALRLNISKNGVEKN